MERDLVDDFVEGIPAMEYFGCMSPREIVEAHYRKERKLSPKRRDAVKMPVDGDEFPSEDTIH